MLTPKLVRLDIAWSAMPQPSRPARCRACAHMAAGEMAARRADTAVGHRAGAATSGRARATLLWAAPSPTRVNSQMPAWGPSSEGSK